MKKFKIILSDYDGTLASSNRRISKENIDSINSFIERGGIFVVCTGRATDSALKFLKEQGFNGLVASFNGAVLTDMKTNKTLYSYGIDNDISIRFFTYLKENDIYGHFYLDEGYLYPFEYKYLSIYEKATGINGTYSSDIVEYIKTHNVKTPKFLIFEDGEKIDKHFDNIKKLLPECNVLRSTENMVDINLIGVDKGGACEKIAKLFGVTLDDLIAVGDAGNDIPMLKAAGFPIAVENALDEVKKVCKAIAPKNDEFAIKYIIEKYCI